MAILFPDYGHVFAFAEYSQVSCKADCLKNGNFVSFNTEHSRSIDFTYYGDLEIHKFHSNHGIRKKTSFKERLLDIFGKLPPCHPAHLNAAENWEIDETVIVNYISHKSLLTG